MLKKNLIEDINEYIEYWQKCLEDAEKCYPEKDRSDTLNKIMKSLKTLIGTYSVSKIPVNLLPENTMQTSIIT